MAAKFFDEVKACNEVSVDGVVYRFKFNEIRKKVGQYWSLVARYINGEWEVQI